MATIWSDYDKSSIGLSSLNVVTVINNYSFREGLIMLPVGLVIWAAMGFYLDAVLPKEYGTKRHPCFMFLPSTYTGCCTRGSNIDEDEET